MTTTRRGFLKGSMAAAVAAFAGFEIDEEAAPPVEAAEPIARLWHEPEGKPEPYVNLRRSAPPEDEGWVRFHKLDRKGEVASTAFDVEIWEITEQWDSPIEYATSMYSPWNVGSIPGPRTHSLELTVPGEYLAIDFFENGENYSGEMLVKGGKVTMPWLTLIEGYRRASRDLPHEAVLSFISVKPGEYEVV